MDNQECNFAAFTSIHSSGRRVFFTHTFGAQQGLRPSLHGTHCLPTSRLSNTRESLLSKEWRNAVAVSDVTSKSRFMPCVVEARRTRATKKLAAKMLEFIGDNSRSKDQLVSDLCAMLLSYCVVVVSVCE